MRIDKTFKSTVKSNNNYQFLVPKKQSKTLFLLLKFQTKYNGL